MNKFYMSKLKASNTNHATISPRLLNGLIIFVLFILGFVIFQPVIDALSYEPIDYADHFESVYFILEGDIASVVEVRVHMLFHLIVATLTFLPFAVDVRSVGVGVSLFFYACWLVTIYLGFLFLLRPKQENWGERILYAFLAIALGIYSQIYIILTPIFFVNYVASNFYHSVTMAVVRPMVMVIFLFITLILSKRYTFSSKWWWLFGAILITLATFTKPSYHIIMLPAILMFVLFYRFRGEKIGYKALVTGLVLPTILHIILFSVLLTNTTMEVQLGFILYHDYWMQNIFDAINGIIVSSLFPISVYILYVRHAIFTPYLNFAWLTYVGGLVLFIFFSEADKVFHGNFQWSSQLAIMTLNFASTVFVISFYKINDKISFVAMRQSPRFWIALVLFIWHVVSGVNWYNTYLTHVNIFQFPFCC